MHVRISFYFIQIHILIRLMGLCNNNIKKLSSFLCLFLEINLNIEFLETRFPVILAKFLSQFSNENVKYIYYRPILNAIQCQKPI